MKPEVKTRIDRLREASGTAKSTDPVGDDDSKEYRMMTTDDSKPTSHPTVEQRIQRLERKAAKQESGSNNQHKTLAKITKLRQKKET